MRYLALACDYDGTLAVGGVIPPQTLDALRQVKASGRKLLLVTGRDLHDLAHVCPERALFHLVVAENGAVLHNPATQETRLLADPVPRVLIELLQARGVTPLLVGRVVVATRQPWEAEVLRAITELGLELHVVFNKGAVMVLPSGVNKASGLHAALSVLGVSIRNTVGIGDAENDHAFLSACECAVAVAGALPTIKQQADVTTAHDNGAGVAELCAQLLTDDLQTCEPQLHRHHVRLGVTRDQRELSLPSYGVNVLIIGESGSGKSTLAAGLVEQIMAQGYQCCVIDPEGDYEASMGMVVFSDDTAAPPLDHVLQVLRQPKQHAVVNLLHVPLDQRPALFQTLLPSLLSLRQRSGSPHWIIIDEAHHVLPTTSHAMAVPERLSNIVFVTVNPAHVAPGALALADFVLVAGDQAHERLQAFSHLAKVPLGELPPALEPGEALYWQRRGGLTCLFRPVETHVERRRHRRKYMEGDVGPTCRFYFRGPQGALNIPAPNLAAFVQVANAVDDATWLFHLRRHDYSRWFRQIIHDAELAEEVRRIESDEHSHAARSRALVTDMIEQRYVLSSTSLSAPLASAKHP